MQREFFGEGEVLTAYDVTTMNTAKPGATTECWPEEATHSQQFRVKFSLSLSSSLSFFIYCTIKNTPARPPKLLNY
jgi:hypothetical protein